jgi:predicted transposase YbfD/YdcC
LSPIVVEKSGEYLWKLRGNQAKRYELANEHFAAGTDKYLTQTVDDDKGHGRIWQRILETSFRLAGKIEFPFLAQVFRMRTTSFAVKTGKQSEQTIYGITSVPVEESSAKELLKLVSKHWRIKNGLHYRRDVTFKEDAVRKQSTTGGQIMVALNNLAIGIRRKTGWENIAQARRFYEIQFAKGLELILNPLVI